MFDKNIKLKFITSNYILDESGKSFTREQDFAVWDFEVLKGKKMEDLSKELKVLLYKRINSPFWVFYVISLIICLKL